MATSKDNPYVAVQKQIEDTLAKDKASAEQSAINELQGAWVNKMQSERLLGQTLASQGITGGASESAILGSNVGYQTRKGKIEQNKANRLTDLQRNADASLIANSTQSAQWEATKQAQEEQRFANTITGYDTIAKVDKAMEAAVTAGEDWKLGYLRAQRAALVEQAKAKAEASSSSSAAYTPKTQNDGEPPVGTVSATQSAGYSAYQPPAGNYSSNKPSNAHLNPYYGVYLR